MKRMPNLKITKEEYQNLQRNFTNRGAEGLICFSGKENTIYKIFQSNNQDIPVSFNKQQKIIELYQKDLAKLETLNPLAILKRGYSITYNEEHKVASIDNIKLGQELETKLTCGKVISTITQIIKDN